MMFTTFSSGLQVCSEVVVVRMLFGSAGGRPLPAQLSGCDTELGNRGP